MVVRPVPSVAAEPDQNDQPKRQRRVRRALLPQRPFLQSVRGRGLEERFPTPARRVPLGHGRRRSGVADRSRQLPGRLPPEGHPSAKARLSTALPSSPGEGGLRGQAKLQVRRGATDLFQAF